MTVFVNEVFVRSKQTSLITQIVKICGWVIQK